MGRVDSNEELDRARKSADAGDSAAMNNLGELLEDNGDLDEAARCRLTAGDGGTRRGAPSHETPSCYCVLAKTATWLLLSEVKADRSHPAQRSSSSKPATLAMRSSSEGQIYR